MSVDPKSLEIAKRYFTSNISVGEITAMIDLRALGVKNPEQVIMVLMKEGIIERGEGCFNLVRKNKFKKN